MNPLTALPYHKKVKNHFRQQIKTWEFFATAKTKDNQIAEFKNEILKNSYKFDEVSDAYIYEKVKIAKEKLSLELPVTVYQAENGDELNASILYFLNEAHIIFSGPITKLFNDIELLSVLAHELTHIKLYTIENGDLEVADRIITSIANNYNSEQAYYETARLFRLYTEIYCDRGAYSINESIDPIISSLVKLSTGLDKINVESYLKQAEEIFANENGFKTTGLSHPENFIRAKAIQLWHEKKELSEPEICKMIEGLMHLDHLDIFNQNELAQLTSNLMKLYLKPKWFQSTLVISLAKEYFTDFIIEDTFYLNEMLIEEIEKFHSSIKEYLCYVIFDFTRVDNSLEEIPMGWSLQFSENLRLTEEYNKIIKKELKLNDKKLKQYKEASLKAFCILKKSDKEHI